MPANMPVSNTLGLLIYAEFTGTDGTASTNFKFKEFSLVKWCPLSTFFSGYNAIE